LRLKAKAGEYAALENLLPGVKLSLTPIIEVPPIESKYRDQLGVPSGPKTTIADHVKGVPERIRKSWGTELPVFVDLLHVEEYGSLAEGAHPLAYVFDEGRKLDLRAVPVTGMERSNEYQEAVIDAVERDGRGVCIRVDRQQCGFPTSLTARLQALVITLNVSRDKVDLIFDLGAITPTEADELRAITRMLIEEVPCLDEWRTIAVAASAMPKSVTLDMDRFSVKRIPRAERTLWAAIADQPDLPRIPEFSDYGVTHPDYFDEDPRKVPFTGKIRYTGEDTWVIVKGHKLEGGYDQFHRLAQMLTEQPEFCSSDFSWGDDRIAKCAALEIKHGNQTTWVANSTNHHLRFVTAQLANGP